MGKLSVDEGFAISIADKHPRINREALTTAILLSNMSGDCACLACLVARYSAVFEAMVAYIAGL